MLNQHQIKLESIKLECRKLGLELNENKCEIISNFRSDNVPSVFANFIATDIYAATLLGSPLSDTIAMDNVLKKRVNDLTSASKRLKLLNPHDALVILKNSFLASQP